MGAVSGDSNTASTFAVNAADLTSRAVAGLRSGDRAFVENKVGTLEGPNFFLDMTSVLPVDGAGVLATQPGVGRWLSESLYSGGSSGGGPLTIDIQGVGIFGQTIFVTASVPLGAVVQMFVNGVLYENGVDYTVVGSTVTWLDVPFQLDVTDRVIFVYST